MVLKVRSAVMVLEVRLAVIGPTVLARVLIPEVR